MGDAAPKNKPVGDGASASYWDATLNKPLKLICRFAVTDNTIKVLERGVDRIPDIKANPDVESFQNRDAAPKNKPLGDDASASCTNASNKNPLNLKPGLAFVINHKTFEDTELDERKGSNFDVQKIEEVLERFQIPFRTVPDGTLADVESTSAELENFDFKDYASMIIFIMSHGYENDVLEAKNGKYSLIKYVWYPMLRNKSLEGKVKLLFIQSCKGSTDLMYLRTDSKIANGVPTKYPNNILQFNSCVEGYISQRHEKKGAIFIQTLCEKIEKFGDSVDIGDICKMVTEEVSEKTRQEQIPMMHSNLTTPFVFGDYSQRTENLTDRNTI